MNVNFQIMKRILCCLLAVLVLFCAFARPIEVSAVAAAAGALVCAITPEIAVSAAITALALRIWYRQIMKNWLPPFLQQFPVNTL